MIQFRTRNCGFFIILFLLLPVLLPGQMPRTMLLDYYHTGDATSELFSLDRVVLEPPPWPGNLRHTLDDTNLGKYFFEVRRSTASAVQQALTASFEIL